MNIIIVIDTEEKEHKTLIGNELGIYREEGLGIKEINKLIEGLNIGYNLIKEAALDIKHNIRILESMKEKR